jgi:hypothetical protein
MLLAGIHLIEGALLILGGLALGAIGLDQILPGVGAFGVAVTLVSAIFLILLGLGLWRGEKWAWVLTLAFQGLSLIGAIMDAKMFAALVSGSIVFYLYMKRSYFHVK